jgi:preprotein translocase subunit SecY
MLGAFLRAFRVPDLRNKILFTLGMVALFRVGSTLPTPGVSYSVIQQCLTDIPDSNVYSLINLFSGGALLQLSVFALGIMPYITASIIVQLLTVVIPRFETLKKEGQQGQNKLTQYTRYLTVALAVLQSTSIIALARSGNLLPECPGIIPSDSVFTLVTMVMTMTAGTVLVMWFGELITDRGVGNGMSLLIFTSVASGLPAEGAFVLRTRGGFVLAMLLLLALVVITIVVFVEQGQRRVPVQYAKRQVGRRMYGGTSTYLPLKVNQAGIIPVIFASSLLYIPTLLVTLSDSTGGIAQWVERNLVSPTSPVYLAVYFLLIVAFAFFYVSITFNPDEVADNMKKYGGFIPGIRPGRSTAEYLRYVLSRLTWAGALYLAVIAVLPQMLFAFTGSGTSRGFFGGAAVLILVGVGLDTVKQIESQLMVRKYEGFLRT